MAVVRVYTLGALETIYDDVRYRRSKSFVGGLDEPLGDDSGDHGAKGNRPDEGQEDEDE